MPRQLRWQFSRDRIPAYFCLRFKARLDQCAVHSGPLKARFYHNARHYGQLKARPALSISPPFLLPPFSLIGDFGKQNTRGNVSKISVSLACYWQIGSKSTNHSPIAWRRDGKKVTLVAAIGGLRSDLSVTRKTDGDFGNVSAGVLFSKVAYQRKRW